MTTKIKTTRHPDGFTAYEIAGLMEMAQRYLYLRENLSRTHDMMVSADSMVAKGLDLPEALKPERLLKGIAYYISTAFNPDRCLCSCKGMYFCDLSAGHPGPHKDDTFQWDHDYDAGVAGEIKELEVLDHDEIQREIGIRVIYDSVDHHHEARRFKTMKAAQRFAHRWVGTTPEIGTDYAVSPDGIGRITCEGCDVYTLFPDVAR
jgi:hypothetical protein